MKDRSRSSTQNPSDKLDNEYDNNSNKDTIGIKVDSSRADTPRKAAIIETNSIGDYTSAELRQPFIQKEEPPSTSSGSYKTPANLLSPFSRPILRERIVSGSNPRDTTYQPLFDLEAGSSSETSLMSSISKEDGAVPAKSRTLWSRLFGKRIPEARTFAINGTNLEWPII